MAYQSEIEKLTALWNAKPEQYFAPLADAYRKTGDIDMALEVVRAGLTKRPTYLSAHIVLGRCLLDQKNDSEAAQAFEKVLELDAENIIALRVLGEIAERRGDPEGAYKWVKRLLEVDPMNDEAQDALKRLEPAARAMPVPVAPAEERALPAAEPAGQPARVGGFEPTSFASAPTAEVSAVTQPSPESAPVAPSERDVFQLEPAEPAMPALSVAGPVDGLEPMMLESEEPMVLTVGGGGDSGLELAEEMNLTASPSAEFETSQDAMAVPASEPELIPSEAPAPEPESAPLTFMDFSEPASQALSFMDFSEPAAQAPEPVAARPSQALKAPSGIPLIMPEEKPAAPPRITAPRPAPVAVPESQADTVELEPVITETMAEVYLKQGLVHEAREVYRKLVEMRPADATLRSRLAALEQRAAPRFAAAETGGQPARSMLAQMLSARPAPPADAGSGSTGAALDAAFAEEPAPGAPTSLAADELSLAAVFGEEPVVAPPPATQPTAAPVAGAPGFSFDEFFGGKKPDPKPAAPSPVAAAEPDATTSDFLTWLKGLKS